MEKKNIFELSLRLLTYFGFTSPEHPAAKLFGIMWKGISLYSGFHFVLITFLGGVLGDAEYYIRLETLCGTVLGLSMVYRQYLLVLKRREVMQLIVRINLLVEEIINVYGTDTFLSWKKMCLMVGVSSTFIVTFTTVPAYIYSYYKFYVDGEVTSPYEVYFPLEKKGHVHLLVLYQAMSFVAPAMTLIISNTFIGTIVIVIWGVTEKIRHRYIMLSPKTLSLLRQTTQWHSEIIMIVEETNSILGSAFMVDCVLAPCHISLSGYLLIKIGFGEKTNLHKYIFLYFLCLTIPSFFCLCGHVISLGKEKLHSALYDNKWYLLEPNQRKDIILPEMLATKGLTLHYRRAIDFNLAAYTAIVKQSYSFLAILKMLDV